MKVLASKDVSYKGANKRIRLVDLSQDATVVYEVRVDQWAEGFDNVYAAFRAFVLLCEALEAGAIAFDKTTLSSLKGAIEQRASYAKSESPNHKFSQWAINAVGRQRYISIYKRPLKQMPKVIQNARATNGS